MRTQQKPRVDSGHISTQLSRREAIRILGAGASLGAFAALGGLGRATAATGASMTAPTFAKGTIVRTVLKDVAPERITGTTLIHEHLSFGSPGKSNFTDDLALMAEEVKASAADGIRCIVDAGTQGLGRKIDSLRAIATQSGMLIVACGGLHRKSDYPADAIRKSADAIAEDFLALAKSERWGAIGEMGTGPDVPMDPVEHKGLEAAAKAHIRTGLPIITHTDTSAQCAFDQVDLFEAAGVNLNQVVIGHLNDIPTDPAGTAIAIAKRGAYLGFDHSGKPDDPRLDEYARILLAVLEAGHGDRICLSSEFANQKYLRKNGGPGYGMILKTIVPRLRHAGVDEATLHKILVDNPRRAIAFVPKTA
jgi:predicted metal-dependent phosphotriesterase family hydrolase